VEVTRPLSKPQIMLSDVRTVLHAYGCHYVHCSGLDARHIQLEGVLVLRPGYGLLSLSTSRCMRDPNQKFNNEMSETYIQDVLASNSGQDTSYSEVFRGFPQSLIQADVRVVPR
jgi:hypothetical protein